MFENWEKNPVIKFFSEKWDQIRNFFVKIFCSEESEKDVKSPQPGSGSNGAPAPTQELAPAPTQEIAPALVPAQALASTQETAPEKVSTQETAQATAPAPASTQASAPAPASTQASAPAPASTQASAPAQASAPEDSNLPPPTNIFSPQDEANLPQANRKPQSQPDGMKASLITKISEPLKQLRKFLNENKSEDPPNQNNLSKMCEASTKLVGALFGEECLKGKDEVRLQGGLIFQKEGEDSLFVKHKDNDGELRMFKKEMNALLSCLGDGENVIEGQKIETVEGHVKYFTDLNEGKLKCKKLETKDSTITTSVVNVLGQLMIQLQSLKRVGVAVASPEVIGKAERGGGAR